MLLFAKKMQESKLLTVSAKKLQRWLSMPYKFIALVADRDVVF